MFITPYFGGCKYTNNFLFINKNIVFQHFVLLITFPARPSEVASNSPTFCLNQPISDITLPSSCNFGTDLSFRPNGVNGEIPLPTIQRCSSDLLHYPYPTPWTEKARKMTEVFRKQSFLMIKPDTSAVFLPECGEGVIS